MSCLSLSFLVRLSRQSEGVPPSPKSDKALHAALAECRPWRQLRASKCRHGQRFLGTMFPHFANRSENQRLLLSIHAQPPSEHDAPLTLSSANHFVFFSPLIHTLSLCHFFLSELCRKYKRPNDVGPCNSVLLAHFFRAYIIQNLSLENRSKTGKIVQIKPKLSIQRNQQ